MPTCGVPWDPHPRPICRTPKRVMNGPPPQIRAVAADIFGAQAPTLLSAMNESLRFHANLHGVENITMFQHAADVMMPRLLREFDSARVGQRYRLERLAGPWVGHGERGGVMVDVGCNLGDTTIAAWRLNPALRILCLEPMPITYLYLRWNLLANGVPALSPNAFSRAHASRVGGVLALHAGASADGRSLSVEYSPTLSGFGFTSASSANRSIVLDAGIVGMRNGVR